MAICQHGRAVNNCPLCPTQPAPKNVNGEPMGELLTQGAKAVLDMHAAGPVRIPNTAMPAITDPTARLAQEYAQELEDMAAINAAVLNTRQLLAGLERELAAAAKRCAEKQVALHDAVLPATIKTRKKRKPVLEILVEKERPAAKEETVLAAGDVS